MEIYASSRFEFQRLNDPFPSLTTEYQLFLNKPPPQTTISQTQCQPKLPKCLPARPKPRSACPGVWSATSRFQQSISTPARYLRLSRFHYIAKLISLSLSLSAVFPAWTSTPRIRQVYSGVSTAPPVSFPSP